MQVSDDILDRARAGERAAEVELFAGLYPLVRKHVAFCLSFGPLVDDAVQEAMLAIHRGLPGFRGDARLTTWALRIATRTARRYARRNRGQAADESIGDAAFVRTPSTGDAVALARAMALLTPKKREAFLLIEVLEMTAREAAEVLGVPANTAASRCRHARAELAAILDEPVDAADTAEPIERRPQLIGRRA